MQTVFYLTYKLLLSRESFHAFNRGVLLAMQAAALLLPLLHVTLETPAPVHQTIALAEAAFVQTAAGTEGDGSGLTLVQALTLVRFRTAAVALCGVAGASGYAASQRATV